MNHRKTFSLLSIIFHEHFYFTLLLVYTLLILIYVIFPAENMFTISALIYPLIALIPFLIYIPSAKKVGFSWKDKFSIMVVFNALGAISWFIAEVIWCYYYNLFLRIEIPYPSEADFFYILASVLVIVGIAVYINSIYQDLKGKIRTEEVITSVIFTGFLMSFIGIILFYPITTYAAEEELAILCLDLIYVILDVIMTALIFFGFLIIRGKIGKILLLFLLSGLFVIVYDVAFAYLDLIGLYYDGHPIELLDIASYFLDMCAFYEIYKLYQ